MFKQMSNRWQYRKFDSLKTSQNFRLTEGYDFFLSSFSKTLIVNKLIIVDTIKRFKKK